MKNNNYDDDSKNPYHLTDDVIEQAFNKFGDEIRPNFYHLRGIERAREINKVVLEFFEVESPALESWLRANGFLE